MGHRVDLSTTGGVTHDKSVAVGGQGVLRILWGALADPPRGLEITETGGGLKK